MLTFQKVIHPIPGEQYVVKTREGDILTSLCHDLERDVVSPDGSSRRLYFDTYEEGERVCVFLEDVAEMYLIKE